MKNTLKLFVWEEVLTDYTDGVMFALAESKEEAMALILNKAKESPRIMRQNSLPWMEEELELNKPKVYENPVGFFLLGGG